MDAAAKTPAPRADNDNVPLSAANDATDRAVADDAKLSEALRAALEVPQNVRVLKALAER